MFKKTSYVSSLFYGDVILHDIVSTQSPKAIGKGLEKKTKKYNENYKGMDYFSLNFGSIYIDRYSISIY